MNAVAPVRRALRPLPMLALAVLLLVPVRARAVDYNFAGSVSLNYKLLANELSDPKVERSLMLSGFNINASAKAVVDVTRYLSATTKVCYGCHGFELQNFTADLTPHPAFNVRAGRFMPSFGDFYLRQDPTSHKTPDNPLPYDMGHMVHGREWGYGILPTPFVDNGVEFYGTVRPTEWLSIYYSAHLTNGWKGAAGATLNSNTSAHDFAYQRGRFVTTTDYIVDNNRTPQFGGRLAMTFARGSSMSAAVPDVTLGASAMYGYYDDNDQLSYLIYGVDAYVHLWRVNLRAELLRKQIDMDARLLDYPDMPSTGLMGVPMGAVTQSTKDGFYVESDFPLGNYLEGVLRVDGLHRYGPRDARANPDEAQVPPAQRTYRPPPSAALDLDDFVMRYTVGLNVIPMTGAKIKIAYEYWNFKSVTDDKYRASYTPPFKDEYMIHLALVASF